MNYVIAAVIGLASGVTSGLFGVGGGIIMVPAMMLLLGFDIRIAIGTSLAVIVPTAMMGSYKHYLQGNLDWRMACALAPFAIGGGYLGAWLTTQVSSANLRRAFGGFLVLVGARLLFVK